jgi:hypothetical protein
MKTEIKLTVTDADGKSLAPFFRIKIDSDKAPYIVVNNRKYYFTKPTKFPFEFTPDDDRRTLHVDIKDGYAELEKAIEAYQNTLKAVVP